MSDDLYAVAAHVSAAAAILTGDLLDVSSSGRLSPVAAIVQVDRDRRIRVTLVAEERTEGYHGEGDSWRARR